MHRKEAETSGFLPSRLSSDSGHSRGAMQRLVFFHLRFSSTKITKIIKLILERNALLTKCIFSFDFMITNLFPFCSIFCLIDYHFHFFFLPFSAVYIFAFLHEWLQIDHHSTYTYLLLSIRQVL